MYIVGRYPKLSLNQALMNMIDCLHLTDPSAGTLRLSKYLRRSTWRKIGRKRVRRLMRLMGIEAIYPRKRTTIQGSPSGIFPYRLRCLKRALIHSGSQGTTNTDQGCQFTSAEWITCLQDSDVTISMDAKGRWIHNVMIERFWRSIKYEAIYLKSYETPRELAAGIKSDVLRYNKQRPHSSISDKTPEEAYKKKLERQLKKSAPLSLAVERGATLEPPGKLKN